VSKALKTNGREFHSLGATTQNARSPLVLKRVLGTVKCHVYDIFRTGCVVLVVSSCYDKDTAGYDVLVSSQCVKDISNNVIFCIQNGIIERITVVINMHETVLMSVLGTPFQVKCCQ